MFFQVLQGINHAQCFVHVASQRHIVHQLVAYFAFAIDQEQTAVGNQFAFSYQLIVLVVAPRTGQNVEIVADDFVRVCNDGVGYALDPALFLGQLQPTPVGLLGVCGNGNQLHVFSFEFRFFGFKSVQFRRANEGKVLRVEEQHNVFAAKLAQGKIVYNLLAVDDGFGIEVRGLFAYQNAHGCDF